MKIRRYERTCNEVLSDRVKIAVVQKGIEDEDLRCQVLMQASRLSTYPLVREEIRSIITARETLNGPTLMDVSAVYKGKEGKEKGKGKGKKGKGKRARGRTTTTGRRTMICYYCHRKGHRKRDCRTFEKDSKKGANAVDQALGLTPGADAALSGTPSRGEHDRVRRLDSRSQRRRTREDGGINRASDQSVRSDMRLRSR